MPSKFYRTSKHREAANYPNTSPRRTKSSRTCRSRLAGSALCGRTRTGRSFSVLRMSVRRGLRIILSRCLRLVRCCRVSTTRRISSWKCRAYNSNSSARASTTVNPATHPGPKAPKESTTSPPSPQPPPTKTTSSPSTCPIPQQ